MEARIEQFSRCQPPFVWPLRARRPPAPPRVSLTTSSSRCTPSATRTRCAHHPPRHRHEEGSDLSAPTLRDRREDVISIPACAHSPPPRLVSSCLGVAYARPLQVPWWLTARGKYDIIIQGEHAAKQLQARARAQPCSCAPNPFRVPRCARLALINAIRAPLQDKYDVLHTTESLYYTRSLGYSREGQPNVVYILAQRT